LRRFDKILNAFLAILFGLSFIFSFYSLYYSGKVLPRSYIASIEVSGMSRSSAIEKVQAIYKDFAENGIRLRINGKEEILDPKNIELKVPSASLIDDAWLFGRKGKWHEQLSSRILAPFSMRVIQGRIEVNEEKLKSELALVAAAYDIAKKDIRYDISGKTVRILEDTAPGKILDRKEARIIILDNIARFNLSPIDLFLKEDRPTADITFVDTAKEMAERMIAEEFTLARNDRKFKVTREQIGSWIVSEYEGNKLIPGLNRKLISEYIAGIADEVDIPSQNTAIKVEDGKVTEFVPPKSGHAILQNETIQIIESLLQAKSLGKATVREISVPVAVKKPVSEGSRTDLGIVELMGKATTPFTGSPANRIHNIKNGVKFLTGILVPPDEEFSTVGALGAIDNTAGYLPELVIKGDETIPEFGGGLCQVSTTLFRAVMNSGLPVVERRNHSYRVPYYERDGEGNLIGPGLDATIYEGWPDFKFKNDTSAHILIQGYVEGDKATFEFYGTGDGRKSFIDGPETLKETPPPDTVYIKTAELPKGEKKKIDTAHAGGTAVAIYKIEYPDGRVEEQEFKSYYRPWPEKWLVGTATTTTAFE